MLSLLNVGFCNVAMTILLSAVINSGCMLDKKFG
jgi:hypothetical protein